MVFGGFEGMVLFYVFFLKGFYEFSFVDEGLVFVLFCFVFFGGRGYY